MCDVIMTSFLTSFEGHVTTPYKRGVAREYPSVHGEPSKWADVRRCDPSGRKKWLIILKINLGKGGLLLSFLLILFYCLL